MTLITASLAAKSLAELSKKLEKLSEAHCVELRLDLLDRLDIDALTGILRSIELPIILTLRHKQFGGGFEGSFEDQLAWTRRLADLQPSYFDIEWGSTTTAERLRILAEKAPTCRRIVSHHDLEGTPADCVALLQELACAGGDILKLATYARSGSDGLRLLGAAHRFRTLLPGVPLVPIAMGSAGQFTRTLAGVLQAPFAYGYVDASVAPGQISIEELKHTYRVDKQSVGTQVYGLIGDPVDKSPSHRTHNAVFKELGIDAVYTKIPLQASELPALFLATRMLPFRGFSVTMPLKQEVLNYVSNQHPVARACGAANTIQFHGAVSTAFITDGVGTLDAIEARQAVEGRRCIILGAGGAARAVAWEAKRRGAEVVICNRTVDKACRLAMDLDAEYGDLLHAERLLEAGGLILINATSVGMAPNTQQVPISTQSLHPDTLVMDVVSNPPETRLLQEATVRGCATIRGTEMFLNQALEQFAIWFGHTLDRSRIQETLEKAMPWQHVPSTLASSLEY